MRAIKFISTFLNIFYPAIICLVLLDALTAFEIKNQVLKSFAYFGLVIGSAIVLIWNLLFPKTKRRKITGVILPVLILIFFVVNGPLKFFFSTSAWQTQTILYQNVHFSFKKVEYQMQDIGALGHNQRTVEVLYLTKLFMIVKPIPQDIDKKAEWIKVDKEVNELGLKYP
jgi:hypothetical protein